jgi:hypothetical protein
MTISNELDELVESYKEIIDKFNITDEEFKACLMVIHSFLEESNLMNVDQISNFIKNIINKN